MLGLSQLFDYLDLIIIIMTAIIVNNHNTRHVNF